MEKRSTRTTGPLVRVFQIASAVLRHLLLPAVLPWRGREAGGPVRVRRALEELGGAWVKLGQMLALRFDLLPPEYCYELFKLLNEVRPFPFEQARRIIEEDFGQPPETLFRSFEPEPFAAASIGQVHRARLQTGERVAVKVQRPQVARDLRTDIRLMHAAGWMADLARVFGATRTSDIVTEFARWTARELDYRIEARHALTLARNAGDDPLERNAAVHLPLSSRRVLTTALVEGVPVIDIIYAQRDGDAAFLERLAAAGHDRGRIARHVAWNTLNQVYRFGYFHADLHPANLFVLERDAIGYVDFGIVGALPAELRDSLAYYAWQLFQGNVDMATDEFMRWVTPTLGTDISAAREDMMRILDDYLFTLREPASAQGRKGWSAFEIDMLNVIRRHELTLASPVVIYLKALVTATAVIYELAPDFDLQGHENRFFSRLIAAEFRRTLDPRSAAQLLFDYGHRVRRTLASASWLEQAGRGTEELVRRIRRRLAGLAATAVVLAAFVYVLVRTPAGWGTAIPPTARTWLAVGLGIVLVALLGGLLHQRKRLRRVRRPGALADDAFRERWLRSD